MDADEQKPKRIVPKGSRKQKPSDKVKQSVMLERKTSAKLAAYARWHGVDPCDVVEQGLAPILADVRLGLGADENGQASPTA